MWWDDMESFGGCGGMMWDHLGGCGGMMWDHLVDMFSRSL
jgi:hypothetical protein